MEVCSMCKAIWLLLDYSENLTFIQMRFVEILKTQKGGYECELGVSVSGFVPRNPETVPGSRSRTQNLLWVSGS